MVERHIGSSEEPTVAPAPDEPRAAARFLLLFSGILAAVAAVVFAVSVQLNIFGYFGDTGYFHVLNDRKAKVDFLRSIPREDLPEAYFLGSSDMLPFQPSQNEQIFGLKTFNLGNFWGRVEEMWAWTNFLIHDLGAPPKMLIIGVEPWTFSADTSGPPLLNEYRRRFIVTEDLVKYAPQYSWWRGELSKVLDQMSQQNLKLMLKTLMNSGAQRSSVPVLEDGHDGTHGHYNGVNPAPAFPPDVMAFYEAYYNGELNDPASTEAERSALIARQYIRRQEVLLRLPKDRMDDSDIDLFEHLMELAQDHDIEVGVILLPVHPYFKDLLSQQTRYSTHIEVLKERMADLQGRYDAIKVVFDATDLSFFGGDPNAFHDQNHMTPVNTRLIMDAVAERWGD